MGLLPLAEHHAGDQLLGHRQPTRTTFAAATRGRLRERRRGIPQLPNSGDCPDQAGNAISLLRRAARAAEVTPAISTCWSNAARTTARRGHTASSCGMTRTTPVATPVRSFDRQTGVIWLPMTWNRGTDNERQIMDGTSQDVRHPYITSSSDDGLTWTPPVKISNQVRKDHWRWYATGPGNAIQLTRGAHQGRLLVPANHSDHSDPARHPYRSHVFWSDDHGRRGNSADWLMIARTNRPPSNWTTVRYCSPCDRITANIIAPPP